MSWVRAPHLTPHGKIAYEVFPFYAAVAQQVERWVEAPVASVRFGSAAPTRKYAFENPHLGSRYRPRPGRLR